MGNTETPSEPTLSVDFAGEATVLSPGSDFSFGRGAANDLDVDSNPQLHRRFGELVFRDGSWWLRNNGGRLPLTVLDAASQSSITLTSGREASLTFQRSRVVFEAGPASYALELELSQPPMVATGPAIDADEDDDLVTKVAIDEGRVVLVGEQRLLAVALAEDKLRNPHKPTTLPTNKAVAHRFGWSTTTFNRKLDRICKKLSDAGVRGLVGGPGGLASDRRTRLVDYLVSSGGLTTDDLALLEIERF